VSGKPIYELSEFEISLLKSGIEDPDAITDYFFRQKGAKNGWKLDENFDPEGKWQRNVHRASQKRIVVIGGFGSGKTKGIALSACVWALLTKDFTFMNCAPASWQSELMYKFVTETLARDTVFEKMIFSKPKRPYPMVDIRFRVRGQLIRATLEFMSVDKNAKAILSWEGDWVNIDEAGLIDDLGGTIINLGSRMRGHINGRPFLGRMSMCSNSWDNPELWYRYDLAHDLPDDYLSMAISSRYNHNITPEQLKNMLKDIPEEEHDRFIDAARPEGRGNYFSKSKIYLAEDDAYSQFLLGHLEAGAKGFAAETTYGCGVTYFEIPHAEYHEYMLIGDPGTGAAPNRNAPVLQVWDIHEFPKYKATLVAFFWGDGKGSITPFYRTLFHFMVKYNPIVTAVDNTGPQKNTSEILNNYILASRMDKDKMFEFLGEKIDLSGVYNPVIQGMDFSGGKKPAYLIAGRLMLEAQLFSWPKIITGMRSQLSNYDPDKDSGNGTKIPQDLVAAYCMSGYAVQVWFHIDPSRLVQKPEEKDVQKAEELFGRAVRSPVVAREQRNSGRSPSTHPKKYKQEQPQPISEAKEDNI
jgi:hypothetical protein